LFGCLPQAPCLFVCDSQTRQTLFVVCLLATLLCSTTPSPMYKYVYSQLLLVNVHISQNRAVPDHLGFLIARRPLQCQVEPPRHIRNVGNGKRSEEG